jgi:hypothetical protein
MESPGSGSSHPVVPLYPPISNINTTPIPKLKPANAPITERQVFAVINQLLCETGHLKAVREYIAFRTFIMQLPRARFIKSELNYKQATDYSDAILKELWDHPDYTYIHADTNMLRLITNPNIKNTL